MPLHLAKQMGTIESILYVHNYLHVYGESAQKDVDTIDDDSDRD